MKKILLIAVATLTLTSCATVFGGRVTTHQRTKPNKEAGEPARRVRIVPLVANAIFWPWGIGVDFLTGAAYKPNKEVKTSK